MDNPAARAIWARARLRTLEDRYASGDRSLESEIVEVSLKYGVLCRFTAFVAVDSQVVAEGGPGHRVIQPVELPNGWENPAAAMPMMQTMMVSASAPAPPPGLAAPGAAPKFAASGMVTGAPQAEAAGGFGGHSRMLPTPAPMRTPRQELPREQLVEELERLRAVASLPVADRLRHLEDLGSRLSALAVYLGGHAELEALARDLQSGGDVDTLLRRAVEGLEALIGPGRRRAFWKR